MQSALERRQAMLELLSDRRQETVANLMAEFGVSRCTVLRDIETLITMAAGICTAMKRLCCVDSYTGCSRKSRKQCRVYSSALEGQ